MKSWKLMERRYGVSRRPASYHGLMLASYVCWFVVMSYLIMFAGLVRSFPEKTSEHSICELLSSCPTRVEARRFGPIVQYKMRYAVSWHRRSFRWTSRCGGGLCLMDRVAWSNWPTRAVPWAGTVSPGRSVVIGFVAKLWYTWFAAFWTICSIMKLLKWPLCW